MKTHILGFPRIGAGRELKKALEAYWKGTLSFQQLQAVCSERKTANWETQKNAGLSFVATGDFSMYDHVLDTTAMLGLVPERFNFNSEGPVEADLYFRMARGDAAANTPAMEMTKWFNANYHYIVPEISQGARPRLASRKLIDETREALAAGFNPKPVLVGPITYLSLSKGVNGYDPWGKLDEIVAVYVEILKELGTLCPCIQIDEPILCADMSEQARAAFGPTYAKLNEAAAPAKLLLATYFDALDDNLDLALQSGCGGLHVDLVRGKRQLNAIIENAPATMVISAGVIDGRNIWKTDLQAALATVKTLQDSLGDGRVIIGSSSSLLHSPVDLTNETKLQSEIKNWMAFAVQKCDEIALLGRAMSGEDCAKELAANAAAVQSRRDSALVHDPVVQRRCAEITPQMRSRNNPYGARKQDQAWLNLPLFPTTTIGSFPQTNEIRARRKQFNSGEITPDQYNAFLKDEIAHVVRQQEDLGLDVLVHGESERNDMVEYFGQQLSGFCFTQNGWVQSYGSRCVKPPVIYGDISRPAPMTVDWITYAASLTKKPMKGMLTGPVTILCWSFVRDDLERPDVCRQIALAIRDEVRDLEAAGVRIIQIDEAALSEGMPVKSKDRAGYLDWAVDAFRLTASGVADSTQIHTHMCYSEFNNIIQSIADMDADVISIESSRSKMELLDVFKDFDYPNEIGPGVYDIHSPRVPTTDEMVDLLKKACAYIPRERLWVNPDCGLKTRAWPETLESLKNMVEAAHHLRTL